jgi:hypothetical protein
MKISTLTAVAGVTAKVSGSLTVAASLTVRVLVLLSFPRLNDLLQGHIDSGKITLFNVGVPGQSMCSDFPEILA